MQARIAAIILSSFAGAAAAQVGTSTGLLDANSATETELRAAPNVDAALAAKIVASRPIAGASAFDELLAATLGEAQREQLYGRLFVTINLNTAARAEQNDGAAAEVAAPFLLLFARVDVEDLRTLGWAAVDALDLARAPAAFRRARRRPPLPSRMPARRSANDRPRRCPHGTSTRTSRSWAAS